MDGGFEMVKRELDRRDFLRLGMAASGMSLAAFLAACGAQGGSSTSNSTSSQTSNLTGKPLIIGAPHALAGGNQNDATAFTVGSMLAAQEINAAGGLLNGRPLQVVSQDDGGTADTSAATFKQMVQNGAIAIAGGTGSAECLAMQTVASSLKIPFFAIGGAADALVTPVQPWTFHVITQSSLVVKVLLEMAQARKFKRAGVYSVGDQSFGASLLQFVKGNAGDYGITVVDMESVVTNTTNATIPATKLKAANPDCVLIWGAQAELTAWFNAVHALGWNIPSIGTAGPGLNVAEALYPNGSAGAEFFTTVDWTRPSNKAILDKSLKQYGPNKFNYEDGSMWVAYDAVRMIAAGIKAANSDDPSAIRDGIEGIKDFALSVGPKGKTVTFSSSNHQVLSDKDCIPIILESGGKFTPHPLPA